MQRKLPLRFALIVAWSLTAELETLAEEQELDAASSSVNFLAARLGLSKTERRRYLELLLESERR